MRHEKTGVDIRLGVRIPMRDGARLSAILYLPSPHPAATPVVFTLTPYIAQTHHEQGVYFASHGYPFLAVDVRGRGDSEGEFMPIENDAQDGYDIVEWIARQPYCNGKVAMWGGSYMGYVQWAAAKEFPPHLATIVPVAAPFRGGDSPLRGNIFVPYSMQWLALLWGRGLQDKLFADGPFWRRKFREWFESGTAFRQLDTFLGNPSAIFQKWISHPRQDAYWDSYNPTAEEYSRLSLPILTITGSHDGNQRGALLHYRNHVRNSSPENRSRHCLVIGPWDHAGTRVPKTEFAGIEVGPASVIDMMLLHRQWYAWTLQGAPRPQFLQKNVACYVMGADVWRYADALEQITARVQPFYLHSAVNPTDVFTAGALSTKQSPQSTGPDRYVFDPRDCNLAQLESIVDPEDLTDQRLIHASAGKHLVYHSLPFRESVEISGFFRLVVWLSIDQPDTDFRATVHEIGIDGSSIQLSTDWMRARHRESLREERLVTSTTPLRYEFDRFMFVSRLIRKGSRLRLIIGPINSIHVQKNYNSGGVVADESMRDARAVAVELFHDADYPSVLHVPFGEAEIEHV